MSDKVIIQISGPAKSKKTTIAALIGKLLQQHGLQVSLPPDPERDEKLAMDFDELGQKLDGCDVNVIIIETQTA